MLRFKVICVELIYLKGIRAENLIDQDSLYMSTIRRVLRKSITILFYSISFSTILVAVLCHNAVLLDPK
jgi:hypothetical protein